MRWVASHLASLPADTVAKKLTSTWVSMPRVHREQRSKQEKLTSAKPSWLRRHQREEVDIRAQTKGIRSIDGHPREEVDIRAQANGIRSIDRHRGAGVDISLTLTNSIGASGHRVETERVDIKTSTRGRETFRSILLHQWFHFDNSTFIDVLHLRISSFILDIEYGNFFGYINAMHLLYLPSLLPVPASCPRGVLQHRTLYLHLGPARAMAHLAGHQHLLYPEHRQHLLGTTVRLQIQHRHGHPGHFRHCLQRGHLRSGAFFHRNGHHQFFYFHRRCPLKCPGKQHRSQQVFRQQPRHHHCRHLSCHNSSRLCHCFHLHHHLHIDRSYQLINQHPNRTAQQSSQHLPTNIQSLHLLLATQQRNIIIEFFLNIDSLETILFQLCLINLAMSRLSGGTLDDLPEDRILTPTPNPGRP